MNMDKNVTNNTVEETEYSVFHPFSEDFIANPQSYDAQLLADSPGFILSGDMPSAYVASYSQAESVLKNWEVFSSVKPSNVPGMERVDAFNGQPVMNYSDPPNHTRLRSIVNVAFSPRRIQQMSEATDVIIDTILSGISPGQEIDATADIGAPLSTQFLLKTFLGVEEKDHHIFTEFAATLPLVDKLKPGEAKPKAYFDAWARGEQYCRRVLENARHESNGNVIGMIADAMDGGQMSDAEMMAMMVVLFTGGIFTVAAMASSALYYLASNPDIAHRIRENPALAKKHCEETLRLDSPVSLVMRFAMEDAEIGGKIIRKGMPVYVMISCASRDPDVFDDPLRFDIDRASLRHLAFGQGIHSCIGNAITRNALPSLVLAVANRFPNLRVNTSKPHTWVANSRSRHRAEVPLLT